MEGPKKRRRGAKRPAKTVNLEGSQVRGQNFERKVHCLNSRKRWVVQGKSTTSLPKPEKSTAKERETAKE